MQRSARLELLWGKRGSGLGSVRRLARGASQPRISPRGEALCAFHQPSKHGSTFSEEPGGQGSVVLPCAHHRIARSTHFMMPISARTGGDSQVYLPHAMSGVDKENQ